MHRGLSPGGGGDGGRLDASVSLPSQIRDKGGTLPFGDWDSKLVEGSSTLPDNFIPSSSPSSPFSYESEDNFNARETSANTDSAQAHNSGVSAAAGMATREIDDCAVTDMDIDPLISSRKRNLGVSEPSSSDSASVVKKPHRPSKSIADKENVPRNNINNISALSSDAAVHVPVTTPNNDNLPKSPVYQRMYNSSDLPPFVVHVHTASIGDEHDSAPVPLHPTIVGRILVSIVGNDILEIKKSGKGKIRVELRSATVANNLVSNNSLVKHNLKAFIPLHRVMRTGIIRDVPQEIDVSAVQEFLRSPCKVIEVSRLNRRIKVDGKSVYAPSRTLCVKFEGQRLPKHVYLFKIRHEVSPFVSRVRNCYSCFRVGHISKSCKGDARCLFCGKKVKEAHPEGEECHLKASARQSPRCINCLGGHLATSHECPVIQEHKFSVLLPLKISLLWRLK